MEELHQAEQIYAKHKIPIISSAGKSIEETATQVMQELGIAKKYL
jgi:regulator of PEP synthase PpsR (kinase-PPPase family)